MTGIPVFVDALSCATLRAMNPSSLSVKQLDELTKEIFEGCADRLGSAVGYSNEQLMVLGSKAAQVRLSKCRIHRQKHRV